MFAALGVPPAHPIAVAEVSMGSGPIGCWEEAHGALISFCLCSQHLRSDHGTQGHISAHFFQWLFTDPLCMNPLNTFPKPCLPSLPRQQFPVCFSKRWTKAGWFKSPPFALFWTYFLLALIAYFGRLMNNRSTLTLPSAFLVLQISVMLPLSLKNVGPICIKIIKRNAHYTYVLPQFVLLWMDTEGGEEQNQKG